MGFAKPTDLLLERGDWQNATYGADGLRRSSRTGVVGSKDDRVTTHYGYDGSNVVREWTENTAGVREISATYLLGASGAMYKRGSLQADVRWYVYDGLGSVVGEVDVSGTMLATKKHDVFGVSRGSTGTAKSKHGFVGSLGHYSDDETGLVYMRARYYDPAIGRFISEDGLGQGNNLYRYCGNDPVNYVDPDGKRSRLGTMIDNFLATLPNLANIGAVAIAFGSAAILLANQGLKYGKSDEFDDKLFSSIVGVSAIAMGVLSALAWAAASGVNPDAAMIGGCIGMVATLVAAVLTGVKGFNDLGSNVGMGLGASVVVFAVASYSLMLIGNIIE